MNPPEDTRIQEVQNGSISAAGLRLIASHPWMVVAAMCALMIALVVINRWTGEADVPAIQAAAAIPEGAAAPVVVTVRDAESGCRMHLYYEGRRLVSVLPAPHRGDGGKCRRN